MIQTMENKHTTGMSYYLRDKNTIYCVSTFNNNTEFVVSRSTFPKHLESLDDYTLLGNNPNMDRKIIYES